jgi:hypothetical protein
MSCMFWHSDTSSPTTGVQRFFEAYVQVRTTMSIDHRSSVRSNAKHFLNSPFGKGGRFDSCSVTKLADSVNEFL